MIESFCYIELRLKPKEYYALTIHQFMLMSEGYKRMTEIDKNKTIDSWRQTRLISYLLVIDRLKDKNMSMYDFYPLPGDPTKEQQEQSRKEDVERESKWMKSVIDQFRQRKFK